MIDIMVRVNNETCSFLPSIPASICNGCSKYSTSFINANVVWSRFLSRIYFLQPIKNVGWRLSSVKFNPCNYNTTWCCNCFNTIKSGCSKIIVSWNYNIIISIMGLNSSAETRLPSISFFWPL